jgi:hypothetical protein
VQALSGLSARHTAASKTELRGWLAAIRLGDELTRKGYGEINAAATTFCGSSNHFNDPYHFHAGK